MTDKQAYSILLRENECLKEREHCSRQCSSCPWGGDLIQIKGAFSYLEEILKARCPELYLADKLCMMEEILNNASKTNETFN